MFCPSCGLEQPETHRYRVPSIGVVDRPVCAIGFPHTEADRPATFLAMPADQRIPA